MGVYRQLMCASLREEPVINIMDHCLGITETALRLGFSLYIDHGGWMEGLRSRAWVFAITIVESLGEDLQ
jgi:hypothetical protein